MPEKPPPINTFRPPIHVSALIEPLAIDAYHAAAVRSARISHLFLRPLPAGAGKGREHGHQ